VSFRPILSICISISIWVLIVLWSTPTQLGLAARIRKLPQEVTSPPSAGPQKATDFLQCDGRKFKSLDCGKQFPPTVNQSADLLGVNVQLGICSFCGVTKGIEAALFRKTGKVTALNPFFSAATCQLSREETRNLSSILGPSGPLLASVDPRILPFFAGKDLENQIKTSLKQPALGLCQADLNQKFQEEFNFLLMNINSMANAVQEKKTCPIENASTAGQILGRIDTMTAENPTQLMVQEINELTFRPVSFFHTPRTRLETKPPLTEVSLDLDSSARGIVKELCRGKPMVVDTNMNFVEVSNNGGKTWYPHQPAPNQMHTRHAMVIKGVEINPDDGVPYLTFVNSWANGTTETPLMSLSRIPLAEVDLLNSAYVIEGKSETIPDSCNTDWI
jgi:hypothetical protein